MNNRVSFFFQQLDENHFDNCLSVITGPMFVGKTDLLIEIIAEFKKKDYRVLVVKPHVDNRFSNNHIVAHSGCKNSTHCVTIPTFVQEVKDLLQKKSYQVLAIDEFHFFEPEIIPFLEDLLEKYIIVVSGLNKGVANNNLEIMNQILTKADYILRLNRKCTNCQRIGSQIRHVKGNNRFIKNVSDFVGGAEKYRLLCRSCSNFWKNKT